MSYHKQILDGTAAIIEAIVPLTDNEPNKRFKRLNRQTIEEAEDQPSGHRMFSVKWSDGFAIRPFTGQYEQMVIERGIDITIVYRIQDRAEREIEPVIMEDADQIGWALTNPVNRLSLTGAEFISYIETMNNQVTPSESGGSLLLTITVPILYRSSKY